MRARVSSAMPGRSLSANETALLETPARAATSAIVGARRRGRLLRFSPTLKFSDVRSAELLNRFRPASAGEVHGVLNSALRLLLAIAVLLLAPVSALAQDAARPNLAHLDFLGEQVAPPAQAGHTTWRLEQEPAVGMLWTYADRNADGSYRRIGGGPYDAATDTYGQGAFNADDISRAAVVYLRYHRRHHDAHSRRAAYELLRGLAYMQTASGPNAGNVVLWMQPDGTFNPSPEPVELPDPSDSAESYWLARTVWALGEGYREFKSSRSGLRALPACAPRSVRGRSGAPGAGALRARRRWSTAGRCRRG